MLREVIPHFSSSGAERPSAVSACSHLGDFYSLRIPKRGRKIFLKLTDHLNRLGINC